MADFEVKKIEDMDAAHGVFRSVHKQMDIGGFGMSIQDHSGEGESMYPDHAEPDQEEVYVVLEGSAEMDIQGERVPLDPSTMLRVGPGTSHKLVPGDEGTRLLAVGGIPGRPYEPPDMSKIEIDGDGAGEPDYTAKAIEDMEGIYGGLMRRSRAELGVSSFGIGVFDLPPNFDQYPAHDHAEEGQEEVYVVLSGEAELDVDGEVTPIDTTVVARVGPASTRSIRTGDQPVRVLALGATPGQAYEIASYTELGEPDPMDG